MVQRGPVLRTLIAHTGGLPGRVPGKAGSCFITAHSVLRVELWSNKVSPNHLAAVPSAMHRTRSGYGSASPTTVASCGTGTHRPVHPRLAHRTAPGSQRSQPPRNPEQSRFRRHQNRGECACSAMSLADTRYWPGGVRRRGGVSLVCGSHAELGKACSETAVSAAARGRARAGSAP